MFGKSESKGMVFDIFFKVLLVSQSYYLTQKGSHNFYGRHLSINLKKVKTGIKCDISFDCDKKSLGKCSF